MCLGLPNPQKGKEQEDRGRERLLPRREGKGQEAEDPLLAEVREGALPGHAGGGDGGQGGGADAGRQVEEPARDRPRLPPAALLEAGFPRAASPRQTAC